MPALPKLLPPRLGLSEDDYLRAAAKLSCDVPAIKAVAEVESRGEGFLPSGEPKILFERHVFHRLTGGQFSTAENRNISHPKRSRKGTGEINEYGPPSVQHARLAKAVALSRAPALQSASWGRFQVMGFNWKDLGYKNLQEFIDAMYRSEADHLDSFVRFVEANGLADALRRHKWTTFARGYNGPEYFKNSYDAKMAVAYKKHGGK